MNGEQGPNDHEVGCSAFVGRPCCCKSIRRDREQVEAARCPSCHEVVKMVYLGNYGWVRNDHTCVPHREAPQ